MVTESGLILHNFHNVKRYLRKALLVCPTKASCKDSLPRAEKKSIKIKRAIWKAFQIPISEEEMTVTIFLVRIINPRAGFSFRTLYFTFFILLQGLYSALHCLITVKTLTSFGVCTTFYLHLFDKYSPNVKKVALQPEQCH